MWYSLKYESVVFYQLTLLLIFVSTISAIEFPPFIMPRLRPAPLVTGCLKTSDSK